MSANRRKVLTMLQEDKVNVEEAEAMLDALAPQRTVGGHIPKMEIVGESEAAKQLRARVQEVARTASPVLIYGETGTGKAYTAKSIHSFSRRADHPFLEHFCEISVEHNEAEIFGVEDGGSLGIAKRGLLELAQGGTVFLDAVNIMAPETQYRLHSYLTDGYYTRVNGVQPVYADVRIMVATNRDLSKEVKAGRFRADLYDQLRVCVVETHTLRDQKEDIPVLAQYFAEGRAERDGRSVPRISNGVLEKLGAYHWPRNAAELCRVIDEAVVNCDGDELLPAHLPELIG